MVFIKVAIIGSGIIGLTSALRLKELIPDSIITIYADEFPPYTTSDVSAGYWEPFCLDDTSPEIKARILKWGSEAYDRFMKTAQSSEADECGVQALSAYVLDNCDEVQEPFWAQSVIEFRKLNKLELRKLGYGELNGARSAYHFKSTTVDMKRYLGYLLEILESNGVRFSKQKLKDFSKLISNDPEYKINYIINCSGLGARELCNDENVFPVRGQVLRVEAPWVKNCVMYDKSPLGCSYILPLSDLVVLGGTLEENSYSTKNDEIECEKIMARCSTMVPSIKNAKVIEKMVGLRPCRRGGVRLEMELLRDQRGDIKVVHNYGHGGSGVTLSWGCASEVVNLIKQDLKFIRSNL